MTEKPTDCTISQIFINTSSISSVAPDVGSSCNVAESKNATAVLPQVNGTCAMYAAAIPPEIATNLPEGTVFQIMPDATILTTVPAAEPACEAMFQNTPSGISTTVSSASYSTEVSHRPSVALSNSIRLSESNISDIDLSFLNEPEEPANCGEELINQGDTSQKQPLQQTTLDEVLSTEQQNYCSSVSTADAKDQDLKTAGTENCETVIVDVSNPIQLSQNSLIVVDGKKCVLQHDPETGQVVAYPVKEPEKPKKKRGRPRKVCQGAAVNKHAVQPTNNHVAQPTNNYADPAVPKALPSDPTIKKLPDDETVKEKGLLEVVTDDGALVRRSLRKRKRAKILNDYETGNLNQELGSDAEDNKNSGIDDEVKKSKKSRGPGRPRSSSLKPGKCPKSQPGKCTQEEPTQAFLIQTADGQSMMIQVPLSSIPAGMSLQDVAQGIANNFNLNLPQIANVDKEPAISQQTLNLNPVLNVSDFLNKQALGISLDEGVDSVKDAAVSSPQALSGDQGPRLLHTGSVELAEHLEPVVSTSSAAGNLPQVNVSVSHNLISCGAAMSQILPPATDPGSVISPVPPVVNVSSASLSEKLSASTANAVIGYENQSRSMNEKFPDNFMADSELNPLTALPNSGFEGQKADGHSLSSLSPDVGKTAKKNEFQCNNLGIADNFCFPFSTLAREKNSDKIVFIHPAKTSFDNLSTSVIDSPQHQEDGAELKSDECHNVMNAIVDHEYTSKDVFSHQSGELNKTDNSITSLPFTPDNEGTDSGSSAPAPIINCHNGMIKIDCSNSESASKEPEKVNGKEGLLHLPTIDFSDCFEKSPSKVVSGIGGKDSCFDIQRCLAPPADVSISWADVTSILSSCEKASPPVIASTSKALATVIPLTKSASPLLLPKPEIQGSHESENLPDKFNCSECSYVTASVTEYEQHLSTHSEETKRCKCCDYICPKEEDLVQHYKAEHPKCICTKCNYTAEQPYIVKRHMYRHIENGCPCEICGKIYKDHYILKMHIKMVHMPSVVYYRCDVCSKEFNRKAHLKRHKRTHDPDKPYKCTYCSYRGSEKSDVTKHMLVHEEPKHTCDICGRIFRHVKNRDLHVKRHIGQRDFKCGACEFFGYTFTDIRRHIERKHKPEQDTALMCDTCGISFKTPEQLKAHQISRQCELIASCQSISSGEKSPPEVVQFDNGDIETVSLDVESTKAEEITEGSVESPVQRPIILSEITGLPENQVVLDNIGHIISNGPLIINGLDSAESLAGTNLAIISSGHGKSNEVIIDSGQENESLLKMFDDSGHQQ